MVSDCTSQSVLICSPGDGDTWEVGKEATIAWNPRHSAIATQQSINIYIVDLQNPDTPVHNWSDISLSPSERTVVPQFEWFSDHEKLYSGKPPVERKFRIVPSLGDVSSGDGVAGQYSVTLKLRADTIPPDPKSTTDSDSATPSPAVMTIMQHPSKPTSTVDSGSSSGLSGGAIAGIAVSAAVVLLALLLLLFFLRKRRQRNFKGHLLGDGDESKAIGTAQSSLGTTGKAQELPVDGTASPRTGGSGGLFVSTSRRSNGTDDVMLTYSPSQVDLERPQPPFHGMSAGKASSMDSVHMSSVGGDSLAPLASASKQSVGTFSAMDAALIADAYRQKLREPAFEILPDDRLHMSDDNLASPTKDSDDGEDEISRRRQIAEERMQRELAEGGNELKSISRGKTILRRVQASPQTSSVPDEVSSSDGPDSPSQSPLPPKLV
ncbi:hypothetical protein IWQ62_000055 [Dispira parvispora]|uniref:Uncharacterized protein n=1 Tax=Dispira parvispora TaxID=1520584 RepID=A0A9W8AV76_9FUNG|nr:hypothetical protein IWQ62_000055 [Dispira parvispora]